MKPAKALVAAIQRTTTVRFALILAGILVCVYAVSVLYYVQTKPDLGIRSAFGPGVKGTPRVFASGPEGMEPRSGDVVVAVGNISIHTWSDLLNAPAVLKAHISELSGDERPAWLKILKPSADDGEGEEQHLVQVTFRRDEGALAQNFTAWCVLGTLPLKELIPSVLWFLLKVMLFLVGALVYWKRPQDRAAAQFFLLCVVTVGAFMGGYHWLHIATQPVLLVVFMVCAILLPVVSLHFYLLFPRQKSFLHRYPRATILGIYSVPVAFLVILLSIYLHLRWQVQHQVSPDLIIEGFAFFREVIYIYLAVASLWYLACVLSLLHSYARSESLTERNQVKWILLGAVLALVPIGYSFYLAVWEPDVFSLGGATWPMFGASACLTAAFAVSITRYRLMELDKIVSSGMGYFLISFLAALVYYAVVFLGTLVFNQVIASPKLSEALTVSTTALVLMFILDVARSRFKKALDRRFSRDKSQLDRTLQRLGQAIEELVDPPALAQKLLQTSTEILGARRGAVFLRKGEPALFHLTGTVGLPPSLHELSVGCPLIEDLEHGRVVLARTRSDNPTPAQRQLQYLQGEVAQPLIHEGRLLAFLIIGAKDSPYRMEDLDLLAGFGQITVLALKSAEGHRTIEILNRDLQTNLEKISEQQRRILALQTQLRRQADRGAVAAPENAAAPGQDAAPSPENAAGIIGSSPNVRQLLSLAQKVAATDAVVLIRGESGTGKELLARAVHEASPRAGKPFVKVHCAALSANLLESELFGHVKGAFTGAHRDKVGRFEMAHGGTLFLDEIGDISLEVQTKLLRVLQEQTFERVGSSESVQVDVRILAATHQNLESLIRQGRFREDLFYRLNVFPVQVPPLRERAEDIPELALYFLRVCALRCRKSISQIDDDVMALLKGFPWPGNIRQLENVIERAVVITEGPSITLQELPPEILVAEPVAAHHQSRVLVPRERHGDPGHGDGASLERETLVRALAAASGNKAEAARALGLARSTLISRLKKLGLG